MNITETDNEPKQAEIYLYTRPIDGNASVGSASSMSSGSKTSDSCDSNLLDIIQHWIFVVKFAHGKVMYLEANEKNGLLVPNIFNETPKNITKRKLLGKTKVSPVYVIQKALSNSFNMTKYDSFFQNCQNWFTEMYQYFGLDIDKCPIPVQHYIDNAVIITNSLGAGLTAGMAAQRMGLGPFGALISSGAVSSSTFVAQKSTSKSSSSHSHEKKHTE